MQRNGYRMVRTYFEYTIIYSMRNHVACNQTGRMHMYKLLIVEDEKAIAQGIAKSNPWEEWGSRVVGIHANGEEAVAFIEQDKPDLVLSDIRMPKMDGIALMQHLNAQYPEIKIVILSGYNDFEYLQMAIRNHVAEYLLKPTLLEEFEQLFKKMKQALDEEVQQKEEREIQIKSRESNALLRGYGYSEEFVESFFYHKDTESYRVVLLYAQIEEGTEHDRSLRYQRKQSIVKIMNCHVQKRGISGFFLCNYEEFVTGIICIDEGIGEKEIEQNLLDVLDAVKCETGVVLHCAVSGACEDYRMLPQCYEQTKYCIGRKLLLDSDKKIIWYRQTNEEKHDGRFDYFGIGFDDKNILKYILNQDKEQLEKELSGVFDLFRDAAAKGNDYVDIHYVNRICMEILFTVSREIYRYNVHPEKLMSEHNYHYMDVFDKPALESKLDFLLGIFELFMQECGTQKETVSKTGELARMVKCIVDEEYMSNLISLEYVAEKVHKNPSYISKVFKNEFDCNFSSYVTDRRLEKSKELLADPLVKVYEIAEVLGWADVSNFIKVFKKKFGISPDEYRKVASGMTDSRR